MSNTEKSKKEKGYDVQKELRKVDKLFQSIVEDKNLPTFCNFFLECLILGTAENVNLKTMYPKVYKKLDDWLREHKDKILAMRE